MWPNSNVVLEQILKREKKCDKTEMITLLKKIFFFFEKTTKTYQTKTFMLCKTFKKKLACDKTKKKLWQNSKTEIVTNLKNSNCE